MPSLSPEYRLEEAVIAAIEKADLPLQGLRLYHALHAIVGRMMGGGLTMLSMQHIPDPRPVLTSDTESG